MLSATGRPSCEFYLSIDNYQLIIIEVCKVLPTKPHTESSLDACAGQRFSAYEFLHFKDDETPLCWWKRCCQPELSASPFSHSQRGVTALSVNISLSLSWCLA